MQMTDFNSADLYQSAANNWYPGQFSTFTGLNSNLNIAGSPGHQLNTLNQLHHSPSLDSATNAVLHNSPPNSASPQQTHPQNSAPGSQLTNLSNNGSLPPLTTQTTQSNHTTHLQLSPIQAAAAAQSQQQQSRSNTTSLNLSTNSNSTSTNCSNNTLPSYSTHLANNGSNSVAAHLHSHYPTAAHHQFNLPPHSQFSPHSLSAHHPAHQHALNHLNAHHHFLNNNFFPVPHPANVIPGQTASFTTPPSPSSPNNTSINSTTTAFNGLTFRPDSASSNAQGNSAMNAVAAMAAMSRASGLSPTETANPHHQLNSGGYERMHTNYPFAENGSLGRGYTSLIDSHSSRATDLDSFVGLSRHMPTLTNLNSNCNTGTSLDDADVNNMFNAHHHNHQTLMAAGHLNHHSANSANNQMNNSTNLVSLHTSTHNSSVNSSSDSRHNGEDESINCIKQEDEDDKLNVVGSQFQISASLDHHLPMSYEWVKRNTHGSQGQAGNKRKTRTRDKYRVVYSDNQRIELEKEFLFSRYITIRRKTELAAALSLSERQVKIWFQNRRAKSRKMDKKKESEVFQPESNSTKQHTVFSL